VCLFHRTPPVWVHTLHWQNLSENTLQNQEKEILFELNKFRSATDLTDLTLKICVPAEISRLKTQIMKRLEYISSVKIEQEPRTNQRMSWGMDMSAMTSQVLHVGWLRDSTLLVPQCYAQGEGLQRAYYGREATISVTTVDKEARQVRDGGEVITVNLYDEKGESRLVRAATVKDNNDGTYVVRFEPRMSNNNLKCLLHITIRGTQIKESPFPVLVQH